MTAPKIRPLKIFLVENHPDTVRWLSFYLEDEGHTVESAGTVAEATERLRQQPVDVLISDIGLPDGTGWDLLEQLQQDRPLFAIAMSGFGMSDDSARSLAAGFRHHLLKPFRTADLDRLLRQAAEELA
jgi:CheY-like chemotaxis protein